MKKRFLVFGSNGRFGRMVGSPVCSGDNLAEVDFDYCDPQTASSEINRIFVRRINSADFEDWTQAEEWTTRMSETSTDGDAIRALTVIGDKPLPNAPVKEISGGRKIKPRKEHTINFEIDEVTDANHGYMQRAEKGIRVKINYEAGKYMFGGNKSISAELQMDMVLARGTSEIMKYVGTITWVSPETEDRCLSPIYGETVLGSTSFDTTIDFTSSADIEHGSCEFLLDDGTSSLAKFKYNDISPTIGTPLVMTIKVSSVLQLTCNMTMDFNTQPFIFIDYSGVTHTGIIANGDVNF